MLTPEHDKCGSEPVLQDGQAQALQRDPLPSSKERGQDKPRKDLRSVIVERSRGHQHEREQAQEQDVEAREAQRGRVRGVPGVQEVPGNEEGQPLGELKPLSQGQSRHFVGHLRKVELQIQEMERCLCESDPHLQLQYLRKSSVVSEVFNPCRFGSKAKKFKLQSGNAFDIRLGHDLLQPSMQHSVLNLETGPWDFLSLGLNFAQARKYGVGFPVPGKFVPGAKFHTMPLVKNCPWGRKLLLNRKLLEQMHVGDCLGKKKKDNRKRERKKDMKLPEQMRVDDCWGKKER